MKIDDGGGSGRSVMVTSENRLEVASDTVYREHTVSKSGFAYSWVSAYSASSGNVVFYLKNTEQTKKLIITTVSVAGVNAGQWSLVKVTSGTPAGTTITGVNQNLNSANLAFVTSLGNAAVTGSVVGSTLHTARTAAASSALIDILGGIIIGQNAAISIAYVGTAGLIEVTVRGYFDE